MNKIFAWVVLSLSVTVHSFAADQPALEKETAIVHFDTLKEAKLDGTVKDMQLIPAFGPSWQTPYIKLVNDRLTPRSVTVKILGLTKPEYDLYIFDTKNHGNFHPPDPSNPKPVFLDPKLYYVGKKTQTQLSDGFNVDFPGTLISQDYRNYFTLVAQNCNDRTHIYQSATGEDARFCKLATSSVSSWIKRLNDTDMRMRTISIVVLPAGDRFNITGGGIVEPPVDFRSSVMNMGKSIQLMRKDVARVVKTQFYKSDTLSTMTPITMVTRQPSTIHPGSTITFFARLDNQTDQSATATVKLSLPASWKIANKSQKVSLRPFQKNVVAKFSIPVPKDAKTTTQINAVATLSLQTVELAIQSTPAAQ